MSQVKAFCKQVHISVGVSQAVLGMFLCLKLKLYMKPHVTFSYILLAGLLIFVW